MHFNPNMPSIVFCHVPKIWLRKLCKFCSFVYFERKIITFVFLRKISLPDLHNFRIKETKSFHVLLIGLGLGFDYFGHIFLRKF